jgi:enoyl-CoA hydratase
MRARIDACFGQGAIRDVLEALAAEPTGWGARQLELLGAKSPTSLAVTFRQLCAGAALDVNAAMRLEYRLVHRFMDGHDFTEGVRALIIDMDNRPDWQPGRLDEVTDAMVEAYFAPLPGGDLPLQGLN